FVPSPAAVQAQAQAPENKPAAPPIKISSTFKDRMQQLRQAPKPAKPAPKKPSKPASSAIWDTAATLQTNKQNEIAETVASAIRNVNTNAPVQPSAPKQTFTPTAQPSPQPETPTENVIQPGETYQL
ncbi:MAG TPA: hypothetical protein VHQ41_00645, partial [Patescibacteria group bacterium]|nr:hypothetical protein [Patescibacteria group bacterium]